MSNRRWPVGFGRLVLEETDSTNSEAARRAPELHQPTWFLARRQIQARGRRGRAWHMPDGNFAGTLLTFPEEPPQSVALRSFVASLAVAHTLIDVGAPVDSVALKWPNDVLLNGKKIAGILLESSGTGNRVGHLAIGIGVNLAKAPLPGDVEPAAIEPASLAQETGLKISAEDFLTTLAHFYAEFEATFAREGFLPIREKWLALAARLGTIIVARIGNDAFEGIFETVDNSGALVLATQVGRRHIAAADVFF